MIKINKKIRSKPTTPSLTDWLVKIDTTNAKLLAKEDNNKYERLKTLEQITSIKYPRPIEVDNNDLLKNGEKTKKLVKLLGDTECILRLTPKNNSRLPKIRKKGGLLKNNLRWLYKQKINLKQYHIDAIPRCPNVKWATIFVSDENSIWGEIVRGGLSQLVKGKTKNLPIIFYYDFKNWYFTNKNHTRQKKILQKIMKKIRINNQKTRWKLQKKLQSKFNRKNYLKGYFEYAIWPKNNGQLIDYNRHQTQTFNEYGYRIPIKYTGKKALKGVSINLGLAIGTARHIENKNVRRLTNEDIIVCKMITVNHLPLIKRAKAIVTEEGGLLCHAALICRELKKPCIMRVKHATKKIKNGSKIIVDATDGTIRSISD